MIESPSLPDVLTADEAARYLRVSEETLVREAAGGKIPGRKIEDTWRFLKSAIDEWLKAQDGRTLMLRQAGVLADDDTLPDLVAAIYEARGRPETEDEAES